MPNPSAPRRFSTSPPLRVPLARPPVGQAEEPGGDRHRVTDGADPTVEPLPHLLSVAEVCAIFRRSERTLRDWADRGLLKRVEIGGAVFFRQDDIRALLESRVRGAVLGPAQRRRNAARTCRSADPLTDS